MPRRRCGRGRVPGRAVTPVGKFTRDVGPARPQVQDKVFEQSQTGSLGQLKKAKECGWCGFRSHKKKNRSSISKCHVLRVLEPGWTAGRKREERCPRRKGWRWRRRSRQQRRRPGQNKFKFLEEMREMAAAPGCRNPVLRNVLRKKRARQMPEWVRFPGVRLFRDPS